MVLEKDVNYIVSGLERSGTSLLMQILKAGGLLIGFDESRSANDSNPKGYYELEGGKIINRLIDGNFPLEKYRGKFIKITAFGLKFLPPGKYKIIYSERNIEEILDSMEEMMGKKDLNRDATKQAFVKLNNMIKQQIRKRKDIEHIIINYNQTISNPKSNINKIADFLNLSEKTQSKMMTAIDSRLYRQRRN
ncbi:MAG: nucleotide pyrophosphatase [Thermoplasmata archaeon M9B1D]|nr:MAG: nucleotide pyrophosphatase [Thermoplasmata archaeon M8B2D]PNX49582.1 MAG: nucleotide pyrophosphatase [Thermoplasmata archaeon M9B1D]